MKVLVVLGTRPEAIKLSPVIRELRKRHIDFYIYHTGQHSLSALNELYWFGLKSHVTNASWPNGPNLTFGYAFALDCIQRKINEYQPTCVISQGDTTTALAAAQAAWFSEVPYVHIEAGLRSGDRRDPFPEEMNRIVCDQYADLLCCPTPRDYAVLISERIRGKKVCTGNTSIDALIYTLSQVGITTRIENRVLVTIHRRENWSRLPMICGALSAVSGICDMKYVMHTNPTVREQVARNLKGPEMLEPMPHKEFIPELCKASLVVTDSGGLQEECTYLGIPMIVVRDHTERHGNRALISAENLEEGIRWHLNHFSRPAPHKHTYGNGKAASKIVDSLEGKYGLLSNSDKPPEAAHAATTA